MILLGSGDGQALLGQQIVVALGNAFQRSCYDKIPDPNAHRNTGMAVFARGFVNNALAAAKSGFHQRFVQTSGIAANQWRVHFSLNAVFQIGAGPRGSGKKLVKDFVWTRQKIRLSHVRWQRRRIAQQDQIDALVFWQKRVLRRQRF